MTRSFFQTRELLAGFTVFVLLFSVLSTSVVFADDKYPTKSYTSKQSQDKSKNLSLGNTASPVINKAKSQSVKTFDAYSNQKQSCTSPEYVSLKNSLDDASKKAVALKENLYKEWQSQSTHNDDWEIIVKTKLETSQEMQNYLQLQKKYNDLYSTCMSYDARQQAVPVTPKKACPDDEYLSTQNNIASLDQKYGELKRKYLEEGKIVSSSGQYSGTPEQYAQDKLLNSDEVKRLQQTRQKYEQATRDCEQNYLPRQVESQNPTDTDNSCPQEDINQLKIMITSLEKRLMDIKEKTNPEWRKLHDSGQIQEDWPEYARKIQDASPEFSNYNQLLQKLDFLNKICHDVQNQQLTDSSNSLPVATKSACSDDAQKAKQMLEDAQSKYGTLKTKYYDDWKSRSSAGTYAGTWDQYAQEEFFGAPEVIEINQLITKYMAQAQDCLSYVTPLQSSSTQKPQYSSEDTKSNLTTKNISKKTDKSVKPNQQKSKQIKKSTNSLIIKSKTSNSIIK